MAEANQAGKILYLIQQGKHKQAINLYRQSYRETGDHDFELIHQMGLGILDYGYRQSDPEIQLLTIFGASVSAHEEAYYILEEGLKSRYPQIQLVALQSLSNFQYDLTDQALMRAMGSDHFLLRLLALEQLCKKKHPQALAQVESLMIKTSKEYLPLFPRFYAMLGTPEATRLLRRLFNHPDDEVRTAAILSAAKYKRDDLLSSIRQQAFHFHYNQQEAVAYTFGVLKDEKSVTKLEKLAQSQYPLVALAAQQALYQFGHSTYLETIKQTAKKGNVFAIQVLGTVPEELPTLTELLSSSDIQVRLNAMLGLLDHSDPKCVPTLKTFLIRDRRDLGFAKIASPAGCFKAWKAIYSSSQLLKDDLESYQTNLEFKETLLEKSRYLPEKEFLEIAEGVLSTQQNTLIPKLIFLLKDLGTPPVIQLLNKYQQFPGAPLVRQYCNLALYSLKEPGPFGEQVQQWIKNQCEQDLIRFKAFIPWKYEKTNYELTPEETSRLLIETFEAFTINQDQHGLDSLFEAIENGHPKNKYALAGLLLRATD